MQMPCQAFDGDLYSPATNLHACALPWGPAFLFCDSVGSSTDPQKELEVFPSTCL